jgi:hypothetical protein
LSCFVIRAEYATLGDRSFQPLVIVVQEIMSNQVGQAVKYNAVFVVKQGPIFNSNLEYEQRYFSKSLVYLIFLICCIASFFSGIAKYLVEFNLEVIESDVVVLGRIKISRP